MGILDRFRRKKAAKEQTDDQLRPASLPGHVTAYDARADRGTIELENGQLLAFTSAACGGVQPTRYQAVLVTGIQGTTAAEVDMLDHGAVPGAGPGARRSALSTCSRSCCATPRAGCCAS